MACWKAFPNANHIYAGAKISFYELVYDANFSVEHMKSGDDLIIVAPNGTRSAGCVVRARRDEVVIKDKTGDEWILTATSEGERQKSVIYSDMLNAIWTVRHRRL